MTAERGRGACFLRLCVEGRVELCGEESVGSVMVKGSRRL